MTMRTLLLTSFVGGGLAALILALTAVFSDGGLSLKAALAPLLVGSSTATSLFLVFRHRAGEKNC